jgi:hypothetical protein
MIFIVSQFACLVFTSWEFALRPTLLLLLAVTLYRQCVLGKIFAHFRCGLLKPLDTTRLILSINVRIDCILFIFFAIT